MFLNSSRGEAMVQTIARSPTRSGTSRSRADSVSKTEQIEEMLRQVIAQIERSSQYRLRQPGNPNGEEVLEVQVNGARYTLLRSPVETLHTEVTLSPREQEIARLVANGLSNKTIATVLDISAWTVSTHLRRVFAKLEVNSRAEMVARVLKDGLLHRDELPPPPPK
jgi:two-component system, NarL family, nitrate/nitrite response regulator NarL